MNAPVWRHGSGQAEDPRARNAASADGDAGRWQRIPAAKPGDLDTLAWQPRLSWRQRLLSGISVPAAVGFAVFVIAVVITAVVLLRGLTGNAVTPLADLANSDGVSDRQGAAQVEEATASPAPGTTSGAESGVSNAGVIVVHVVGEVAQPGIVDLSEGDRVLDAIEAAGGATSDAVLSALNLARVVSDGEQILVPDAQAAAEIAANGPAAGQPESAAATGQPSGPLNINTASSEELTQLSGIGPALARRIVEWRDSNGRFASVEQLLEVSGIGAKTLEKFREQVTV